MEFVTNALNGLQGIVHSIISAPILFLVLIVMAILWQQKNSKSLAEQCGQQEKQATWFSIIMSAMIIVCVGNGIMWMAVASCAVEAIINILLVSLVIDAPKNEREKLLIRKKEITGMQRKGKEDVDIDKRLLEINESVSKVRVYSMYFIALLMPIFMLLVAELFVESLKIFINEIN